MTTGLKAYRIVRLVEEIKTALDRRAQTDLLDHMSPAELEKVADSILATAESADITAYNRAVETSAEDARYSEPVDELTYADDYADDPDPLATYELFAEGYTFEQEVLGLRTVAAQRRRDPSIIYDGPTGIDHGDYLDGFTITNRP